MAGGAFFKSNEAASNQAAAINAKNASTAQTIAQEQALQKQSSGIFDQTLQPYQGAAAPNLETSQAANTATLDSNAPTAASLAGGATTGNAPKVVADTASDSIASRISKLKASDAALGSLSGYDTANSTNARAVKAANDQIGTIGNFAGEDANVGAARTAADVANSQKAPSPFGDLLSGAGAVGSAYAGGGGSLSKLFGSSGGVPRSQMFFG